jgi:Fe-S-cluster containining protein
VSPREPGLAMGAHLLLQFKLGRMEHANVNLEAAAASLCLDCGLCCDGTLFADVELKDSRESAAIEAMGLEVDDEDGCELLIQPCRALEGTRCKIYPHRPECCRTFECGLLMKVRRGMVEASEALSLIEAVRERSYEGDHVGVYRLIEGHFLQPPA